MKNFLIIAGLSLLLVTSGCSNRGTHTGLYSHCSSSQSSVGVSIVNIPANVSLSSIRVIAINEHGEQITLKRSGLGNAADSESIRSVYFSENGSRDSSYQAHIYFGDQKVSDFPINFSGYWCNHYTNYDAETGETWTPV